MCETNTRAAQRRKAVWLLVAVAWGLGIVGFAWVLKRFNPDRYSRWIALAFDSEAFHIVAHTGLYGILGVLFYLTLQHRGWAVGATVAIGVVQEYIQAWPFRLSEYFDLAVDCGAACLALFIHHLTTRLWRRRI